MEFPTLGDHCKMPECRQLDFLPFKCIGCKELFCKDHFQFDQHICPHKSQFDKQVPVCPLCNEPVPVGINQLPDVRMNEHIETFCSDDRAKRKRPNRIYTNCCQLTGCKQRELVPLKCSECSKNFCLKHRHPSDHKCIGKTSNHNNDSENTPRNMAAKAALQRVEQGIRSQFSNMASGVRRAAGQITTSSDVRSRVQGNLSEDEALARAIQLSLTDGNSSNHGQNKKTNEERDLTEAIERSKQDMKKSKDKCTIN